MAFLWPVRWNLDPVLEVVRENGSLPIPIWFPVAGGLEPIAPPLG